MRAFLAVDVNSQTCASKFEEVQSSFLSACADIKPVERENFHFTIRFLGEVAPSTIQSLKSSLDSLEFRPISLRYKRVGAFPSASRPRVIWVGADDRASMQLNDLFMTVDERISPLVGGADGTFHAHVTILRVKIQRALAEIRSLLDSYREAEFGEDLLTSLKIKGSQLTPRGPIYTDVFAIPFR